MRYFGSKTLLRNQIFEIICEYNGGIFCDPFGGIGTVGAKMKEKGFQVISGDILDFAYFFQYSLLEREGKNEFSNLKKEINAKNICDIELYLSNIYSNGGWFWEEYSKKRKFFTERNAKKIQACINCIDEWYRYDVISENERKVLIASLINSFDKIANTAGTYYAYLKEFDRRSLKEFSFSFLPVVEGKKSYVFKMDAEQLVKNTKCDVLYLDPPYNERNYSQYYHLPETIAEGQVPVPRGKSGIYRSSSFVSDYNKKDKATSAFEKLIRQANAKCILFHYTDNGLIDMDAAKEMLKEVGTIEKECYFNCKGYNTSSKHKESMHHIIKVCL
jgi:adenine-specific DNA-methyltransferase